MRSAFGARFDVPTGYLNTPSIGIPPAHVADVVAAAVARWGRGGDRPPDFDGVVHETRHGFGRLIGVPADRVAVGASVSQLVSMVAAGLPDGARVLVATGEFTSVTFPFAAQEQRGVGVTEVPLADLPAAVPGHDLVAVSVAQSADGSLVDLAALRATAEARGVPVLLDVTQAAGWLPLELEWADWVVCAGYKWLLAPRGAAWLAVHPKARQRTLPVAAGWYAGEDPWQTVYDLPLRLASDARAFDLSPAWLPVTGAAAALTYLAGLDRLAVREHCVGLADRLRGKLGLPACETPIVAFDMADPGRLADAGIVSSTRAGKVRVGFHIYNTETDVERVLGAIG